MSYRFVELPFPLSVTVNCVSRNSMCLVSTFLARHLTNDILFIIYSSRSKKSLIIIMHPISVQLRRLDSLSHPKKMVKCSMKTRKNTRFVFTCAVHCHEWPVSWAKFLETILGVDTDSVSCFRSQYRLQKSEEDEEKDVSHEWQPEKLI